MPVVFSINGSDKWETAAKDVSDTNYEVKKLDPKESFAFRVIAHNKYGQTAPSESVSLDSRAGQLRIYKHDDTEL